MATSNELTAQGRKRTLWIPDSIWSEVVLAAGERGQKENKCVSVSELFRRGVRREMIAHLQPGWYRKPPHIKAIMRAYREDPEGKLVELQRHAPNL